MEGRPPGLARIRSYCYRVLLGCTDLLGTDPSPTFTSQVAAGSTAPFTFAVFGDWGQAYANGATPTRPMCCSRCAERRPLRRHDRRHRLSRRRPDELRRPAADRHRPVSTVFGPTFWGVPGRSIPVFNVTGNHGFTNGTVQVLNWPEEQRGGELGRQVPDGDLPVHQRLDPEELPELLVRVRRRRRPLLRADHRVGRRNIGTGRCTQNDRDAHWTPSSAEYQWLQGRPRRAPGRAQIRVLALPALCRLQRPAVRHLPPGRRGTLQGLLDQNNVTIVFNGHAHGYERNLPDSAGPGQLRVRQRRRRAGLGQRLQHASTLRDRLERLPLRRGAGRASNDHVFGFAKVTVNGHQVTVTPTDATGPHLRRPDLHLPAQRARHQAADAARRDRHRSRPPAGSIWPGAVHRQRGRHRLPGLPRRARCSRRPRTAQLQRHHRRPGHDVLLPGPRPRRRRQRVGTVRAADDDHDTGRPDAHAPSQPGSLTRDRDQQQHGQPLVDRQHRRLR